MDESTTTNEPTDTGVQATQPDVTVDTQAAENQPAEPTTNTDSQEATSTPTDDNLAWLQNKGVDPNSPEALAKVAEMYRNAEKAMHQSTAEKAQLQTALTQPTTSEDIGYTDPTVDPVVAGLTQEVQQLKTTMAATQFLATNPEAKQYEAKMAELVTQDPTLKAMVNGGYFSYENLLNLAKGADSSREAQIKSEGGREALQQVADKQQAKAVAGNATSSAMGNSGVTRENFDSWYAGLSSAERQKPETQAIVNSLL